METFSFYHLLAMLAFKQSSIPLEINLELEQGSIQGIELPSVQENERYVGFLGIPYAKPPVGPLRFKAPQPPDPWQGTLYATKNAAQCLQLFPFSAVSRITGDEDCLFLNVYTQNLPVSADDLRTVMVWFHGGAFEYGSGDKKQYGPDYLVLRDVVVVTVNYRLGPFGFLSTADSAAQGNYGLKDQAAALRWVNKNIALFGGDPNRVTIFGESAGAASVHLHMMSPMSKGLFHKAISQSGTGLNPWSCRHNPREIAFRIARANDCNSTDTHEVIECLRNVSAKEFANYGAKKLSTMEELMDGEVTLFLPTSEEGITGGEEHFLPQAPDKLMAAGKYEKMPHLLGVNSHEGIVVARVFATTSVLEVVEKEFGNLVPEDVLSDKVKRSEVAQKIRQFYFQDRNITRNTTLEIANMMTDLWFTRGIRKTVQIEAKSSPYPVYFYQFAYDGKLGFMKRLLIAKKLPGACHADDLGYLFRIGYWNRVLPPDSPEMITLDRMVTMWTNFAKTGNPTSHLTDNLNITWLPVTTPALEFLHIDTELSMRKDIDAQRMAFWDNLELEKGGVPDKSRT